MRYSFLLFVLVSFCAKAQLPFTEEQFLSKLTPSKNLPGDLLSTRTVVFYPYNMTMKELELAQNSFQRTGIDAVAYLEADLVCAGRDPLVFLADHLNDREFAHLIYFQKNSDGFRIYITPYNKRADLVMENQEAYVADNKSLSELLQQIYRQATASLSLQNFLINDVPETQFNIRAVSGQRNEYFAIDLKVDQLAVPLFGDAEMDSALHRIMKEYPYKYTLVEGDLSENEIRKKGFLYVLRFVVARNKVAQELLGYETTKSQSAIVSVAYSENDSELKTIPANERVFKFYFKHIESKNVFLGRKWDADPSWEQALINQLKAYKIEFRIN